RDQVVPSALEDHLLHEERRPRVVDKEDLLVAVHTGTRGEARAEVVLPMREWWMSSISGSGLGSTTSTSTPRFAPPPRRRRREALDSRRDLAADVPGGRSGGKPLIWRTPGPRTPPRTIQVVNNRPVRGERMLGNAVQILEGAF